MSCFYFLLCAFTYCTAEVEENLRKVMSQKRVQGVIIANSDGIPIRTTLDDPTTQQYLGLIHPLLMMTENTLRDMGSISQARRTTQASFADREEDDLTKLQLRTEKNEILIAPVNEYFMIAIQDISN